MKILFVYPRFARHAECHPELLRFVPMNEYLGSPSLGLASLKAVTPPSWSVEFRDDRRVRADRPTDADVVAISFFTAASTRALELCDYFRAEGKTVVAGGIFPTMMPDVVAPHADAIVIGEGEEVWPRILSDITQKTLAPRYVASPANLDAVPIPDLSLYFDVEGDDFRPDDYPLQLSRGCPLSCHACALPKTMGRSMRHFPITHVAAQLERLRLANKRACLTEDTSWLMGAGRKHLEAFVAHLLEAGLTANVSYIGTSMPMILSTPADLLAKVRRAGIAMFYLVGGFDPITMRAFNGNDARAYDKAVAAVKKSQDADIEPYTSFLIGLDDDDEGTVDRMLEFAEATKLKKAEFAIFTPYPGTPSWDRLVAEDRIITHDFSRYNDANVVFRPKKMTVDGLTNAYLRLWREFYEPRKESLKEMSLAERTIQF